MLNFLFLIWGLVPVGVGVGFLVRPRKMVQAQTRFRKKMEKLEKKLYKSHRSTGLFFVLLGVIFLVVALCPDWVSNAFVALRIFLGLVAPQLFQHTVETAISIKPTYWI